MSALSCRIVVLFFLATFASTADAATVRWILQDVTFTDGTVAHGYFELDATTDTFGRFHIDTVDGPVTPGHSYTHNTGNTSRFVFGGNPSGVKTNIFRLTDTSWELRMTPAVELDDSGGHVDLDLSVNSGNVECTNCGSFRDIASGYLLGITDTIFADNFDD